MPPMNYQDKQSSLEPANNGNSSKEATPSLASTTMETASEVVDNSVAVTRAVTSKVQWLTKKLVVQAYFQLEILSF